MRRKQIAKQANGAVSCQRVRWQAFALANPVGRLLLALLMFIVSEISGTERALAIPRYSTIQSDRAENSILAAREPPSKPKKMVRDSIAQDHQAHSDTGQIIWPPIDQPLDLSGGYRTTRHAKARQKPKSVTSPGKLSKTDCAAAGAFILAGARARDRGVSAASFLGQLRRDLLRLGEEPPATRWFLHSLHEAEMLHGAARNIFENPQAPATHYQRFVADCEASRINAQRH